MIFNEVLESHRKCLMSCEQMHGNCVLEKTDDQICSRQLDACAAECDYDYAP